MALKLGFLAGLATGYVLGTRASFQQRARVDRVLDKVVDLTVGRGEPSPPDPSAATSAVASSDPFVGRASA